MDSISTASGFRVAGVPPRLAGAVFLERTFVPEMIPDHRPTVGVLLVVATIMVGAELLASAGPARRALGIEPSEALREG